MKHALQTYKKIQNLTTGQDQLVSDTLIKTLLETKQAIKVYDGEYYINNGVIVKLESKIPTIDKAKVNNNIKIENKPETDIIKEEISEENTNNENPIIKNIIKNKNK